MGVSLAILINIYLIKIIFGGRIPLWAIVFDDLYVDVAGDEDGSGCHREDLGLIGRRQHLCILIMPPSPPDDIIQIVPCLKEADHVGSVYHLSKTQFAELSHRPRRHKLTDIILQLLLIIVDVLVGKEPDLKTEIHFLIPWVHSPEPDKWRGQCLHLLFQLFQEAQWHTRFESCRCLQLIEIGYDG